MFFSGKKMEGLKLDKTIILLVNIYTLVILLFLNE